MKPDFVPEGSQGDPPCWSHLVGPDAVSAQEMGAGPVIDLVRLADSATVPGPVWSRRSEDLDVNLLVFGPGEGVARHVNQEVDVLLVAISGEGSLELGGEVARFAAGAAMLAPKGMERSITAGEAGLAYLSCHLRRAGIQIELPTSGGVHSSRSRED